LPVFVLIISVKAFAVVYVVGPW